MKPEDIKPDTFPKATPALLGLSTELKDPKNYNKIQKALLNTIFSCHKGHSEVAEMAMCKKCTENMLTRHALMAKFGFKSFAQYSAWKRVHEACKKKIPMSYYNT